jgi:hypothetical protein
MFEDKKPSIVEILSSFPIISLAHLQSRGKEFHIIELRPPFLGMSPTEASVN